MSKVKKEMNKATEGTVIKKMLHDALKPHKQRAVAPIICLCFNEDGHEWIQVSFQTKAFTDSVATSLAEKFHIPLGRIKEYEILDFKTDQVGIMITPISPYQTKIYSKAEKLREAYNLIKHFQVR